MVFVNKSLENLINEARQELMDERNTFVDDDDDDDDEVYMDMVTNNNNSDKMNNAAFSLEDYLDMELTTSLNRFSH